MLQHASMRCVCSIVFGHGGEREFSGRVASISSLAAPQTHPDFDAMSTRVGCLGSGGLIEHELPWSNNFFCWPWVGTIHFHASRVAVQRGGRGTVRLLSVQEHVRCPSRVHVRMWWTSPQAQPCAIAFMELWNWYVTLLTVLWLCFQVWPSCHVSFSLGSQPEWGLICGAVWGQRFDLSFSARRWNSPECAPVELAWTLRKETFLITASIFFGEFFFG